MQITNATTPTLVFLLVSSADDKTAVTGVTPTVQISKNGGAFAATTNAASEIANGWYKVALTATETNTDGALILRATGTGADEWRDVHEVATTRPANVVSIAADAITAAAIADGAIDAATFAAGAIDAAAIATDAIGSAELAASAVTEIQSGLMLAASYTAPPSAATIAAAVWDYLASAASTVGSLGKRIADNLDAAISTRATASTQSSSATSIAAIKERTDRIPDAPAAVSDIPTAAANAAALLDSANAVETGLTPRGALRLISAALAGVLSGAGTNTVVVKNAVANSKTRITATTDEVGNRSVVNTDVS